MITLNKQIILDDCSLVVDQLLLQLSYNKFVEGEHFILVQFEQNTHPISIEILSQQVLCDVSIVKLLQQLAV